MKERGRDQGSQAGKRGHRLIPNTIRVGMVTGLIAVGTLPVWACNSSGDTLPEPTPASAPIPEIPGINSNERRFAENVKTRYGMNVELEFGNLYDAPVSDRAKLTNRYIFGSKPKEHFTEAELKVLQEAIDTIPFCAKINGRLKIFKDPMLRNPGAESGSNYIGTTQPKTQRGESLIMLTIHENSPLDGPNLEPHVLGIDTNAEQLKDVYYHECGHAVSFTVLEAAFPDDFLDITDPSKIEVAYKDEQKNPLYIVFSKLEGWNLREDIFQKRIPDEHVYVKGAPDERMILGYTNLKIAEHFAELFGLYMSNSPVLTDQERMFFGKIKKGFEQDSKEFAKAIAQDPMMLLRTD